MEKDEKKFTVTIFNGTIRIHYQVLAKKTTTLDMMWASEKCWILPGTKVTIKDESGNKKTYVKEG